MFPNPSEAPGLFTKIPMIIREYEIFMKNYLSEKVKDLSSRRIQVKDLKI
jgi:hypothetical protein